MAELAQGWRPSPGDTVRGKVTGIEAAWSDFTDSFYPILTIRQGNGETVAVHCFHTVLRNRLKSIRPSVGDTLEITYIGETDTKDGKRRVHQYAVETDRPHDVAAIWDQIGGTSSGATPRADTEGDIPF